MGGVSGSLLEWIGEVWWCCRTVAQCSKLKQGFELSDPFTHSSRTVSIIFVQHFIHQPSPPARPTPVRQVAQSDSYVERAFCRSSSHESVEKSSARIRGFLYRPLSNIEQVDCTIASQVQYSMYGFSCWLPRLPTLAGFDHRSCRPGPTQARSVRWHLYSCPGQQIAHKQTKIPAP